MFGRRLEFTAFVVLLSLVGCQEETGTVPPPEDATPKTEVETHTHDESDVLVWKQIDIQDGDYVLSLGHHGEHFHSGDDIEPAVRITKDDADVADAIVHNCLVAEDGETVIAEEKATVFEPKTDDEPAHYAQGALTIPKDTEEFLVRFRIRLPGGDVDSIYDIKPNAH